MHRLARYILPAAILFGSAACAPQPSGSASDVIEHAGANVGTKEQQQAAYAAAKIFLNDIDSGHVEATWAYAGPALRAMSNEQQWVANVQRFRSAFGDVVKRKLKGFGFTHHLAGAPAGDYVAVGFSTQFKDVSGEEKLVFQKEGEQWKIIGYFMTKKYSVTL